MKKRLLHIFSLCLPLALLFAALTAGAAGSDIIAKGDCGVKGSSVQWSLDSNGNLTISGSGVMSNYSSTSSAPWYKQRSMITSVTVSDGVTGVGAYAFYGLNRLMQATLPESVSSIENYVFRGCSNLLSFTISDNVTSIGNYAFYDCDRLTEMTIPHSVINIGANAFAGCDVLQSVTMLADVPSIKTSTFAGCKALNRISIPENVVIIMKNAFSDCVALKDVYFTGTSDMWKEINVDTGNTALNGAEIHCDTSPGFAYRINALTVSDSGGKPLSEIPNGSFLATVSVTNRAGTSPLVFLAAYSDSGKFQDFMYVTVKEPIGATVEVTLPVDNSAGNIAELKAFAVSSFSELTPLGASVSFPAQ